MENVDMFNNATAQLTFHDFLDRMRHPSAADLVRSIKNFIGAFLNNPPQPEKDSQSVQEFLTNTENAFKAHPLWVNATEEEFESSGEGLEKYLMTKLFARAFAPLPEDAEHDQRLSEKMSILQQFIRPEHLDIHENFQNETSWLLAQKELQKINTYKAPRDKLVCILNCCRVINNLLLNVSMATNDNPPGADDFLPVLIYVVIKANPPQLHSNLLYIQRYRHHSRLVSEASYFYTNLVSAESFIENLDSKSLTIDPAEFQKKMESGQRAMEVINGMASTMGAAEKTSRAEKSPVKEKMARSPPKEVSPVKGDKYVNIRGPPASSSVKMVNQEPTISKVVSVEKLEAGAFGQILEADETGRLAKDYPFLYASAGDLRVADVETLLHEYKELVLRYVALSKAVEGSATEKPSISVLSDPRQGPSTDAQLAAGRTESLAQILTRPEETAELFIEATTNLQPDLVSESQGSDSAGLDYGGSLGENNGEKNVLEDADSSLEETKEEDQEITTRETVKEDPDRIEGEKAKQEPTLEAKVEDLKSSIEEAEEVLQDTPSEEVSTEQSTETELSQISDDQEEQP